MTPKNWFWVVLVHSGLMQAGVYVIRPMVSYQSLNFGADATLVGFVGAAFAVAPLFLAIPVGRLIDRNLAGLAVFLGSLVSSIATLGLIFAQSISWLLISMPLLGIGHLLGMVGGQTLISNLSPSPKLERNFGLLTFYASLGHAFGPFFGGLLASESPRGVDVVPALIFGLGLLLLSALVAAGFIRKVALAPMVAQSRGSIRELLRTKGYRSAIFVAGATTAVVDVLLVFLPVIGLALGFSTNQIGFLLAIRAVGSMLTRVTLGPLTTKFGFKLVLILSALIAMIATLALTLFADFVNFAVAVFIVGLALAVGQPLTMAWVSRIAPKTSRGLAISIRLTSNRLGQVVVPAIAGALAAGSVVGVFYLLAGLLFSASLVSWTGSRGHSDPDAAEV